MPDMRQVYTGTAADARDIRRSLALMGADSASTTDALGRTTVFVPEENLEEARVLLDAIEQIEIAAAHVRVADAVAFRGGRTIEGRA